MVFLRRGVQSAVPGLQAELLVLHSCSVFSSVSSSLAGFSLFGAKSPKFSGDFTALSSSKDVKGLQSARGKPGAEFWRRAGTWRADVSGASSPLSFGPYLTAGSVERLLCDNPDFSQVSPNSPSGNREEEALSGPKLPTAAGDTPSRACTS